MAEKGIKALFIDECSLSNTNTKQKINNLSKTVEVLWIAPNTSSQQADNHVISGFITINLTKNMRNSKEVVLESIKYSEKTLLKREKKGRYPYKEGLVIPHINFPTGCRPTYVESIADGLDEEES